MQVWISRFVHAYRMAVSTGQLNALLHLHFRPIKPVFYRSQNIYFWDALRA